MTTSETSSAVKEEPAKRVFRPSSVVQGSDERPKLPTHQTVPSFVLFGDAAQPAANPNFAEAISSGLAVGAVYRLMIVLDITQKEILELLNITSSTFNRRKRLGILQTSESDRVFRYARLAGRAVEMFHGDDESACQWLKTPAPYFKGDAPLSVAKTEYGARQVEDLIGRIRHGVPS